MFEPNFSARQQYIKAANDLNKPVDSNIYKKGHHQKVELDKKLEEISIKGNLLVSGKLARQNILDSTLPSARDSLNSSVINSIKVGNTNNNITRPMFFNKDKFGSIINQGKVICIEMKRKERNKEKEQDDLKETFD